MYNLQGDKIDRRVCTLISWGLFLWRGFFLAWVLQLVLTACLKFRSTHTSMDWQARLSQVVPSFLHPLLDWLLRLGTTKPVCLGFFQGACTVLRFLSLGSLCCFPQVCFFISLKNNLKSNLEIKVCLLISIWRRNMWLSTTCTLKMCNKKIFVIIMIFKEVL